jgi:hypothetical protein
MAGLVPAIHVLQGGERRKDVDARDKPGHDDLSWRYLINSRANRFKAGCVPPPEV